MPRPLRVGPFLAMLMCMALPPGSLEITLNCSTRDLPVFQNSAVAPKYPKIITLVPDGTPLEYICNQGSQLKPGGSTTIVCVNGSWTPNQDPCVQIAQPGCPTADLPVFTNSVPVHGYSTPTVLPHNTAVQYKCKNGSFIKLTGSNTIVCVSGSWEPKEDKCYNSVRAADSIEEGVLTIRHGMITQGRKEKYRLGDRATVECLPGYVLHGDPVIQYSGGNKWEPKIPSCSLSIFISIFVAVITLGIVVLIFLVVYKNFHPQESSNITVVRFH